MAGVAAILSLTLCRAFGEAEDSLSFETASMKLIAGPTAELRTTPTSLTFRGYPLGFLIRWAYDLHPYQAFETVGPDWIEPGLGCPRYDIVAKTDRVVSVRELRLMLRTLLTQRFRVAVHRETRDTMVYVLSAGKDGPKLRKSENEIDEWPKARGDPGSEVLDFTGASIQRLTETLSQFVAYLVVDETGIQGRYDFTFDPWKYRDYAVPDVHGVDMGPAFNRSLEPLGLRLEPKRRTVKVIVIDHVEKTPTQN